MSLKSSVEDKGVQVRTALDSDIPAIQSLYRELDWHHVHILPRFFQHVDGDIRTDESIAEWIGSNDKACFVAAVGDRITGFVFVAERQQPAQPMYRIRTFALIDNAVVSEEYRSRGIGQALFGQAIEWARARGITELQVSVWNENLGAYGFYHRQGFRPVTTRMELSLQ